MSSKATDGQIRAAGAEIILSPDVRTSSVIAALAVSPSGVVLAANRSMLTLIGRPLTELLDENIRTSILARPSDWAHWEKAKAGAHVSGVEMQLNALDGRTIFLRGDIRALTRTNGDRHCLSGVFVDITATKQLDNTLDHTARMEAFSNLTSGIAHDFSNLLTVLVGNLYLISEAVRDRPPLHEKAKLARDAAKRGIDLIRQLLAFARNDKVDDNTLDVGKLFCTLEPLLTRALGSRVKLETSVGSDVSLIDANAAQLESAIVNLVINARDAIESTGTICFSATNVTLDDLKSASCGVSPGDYVRIAISDDGAGIPEALLARVFDPFFSTKGDGKGTGLGLCMVRRFAEHAGGAVVLKSRPGKGTSVFLLLPQSTRGTGSTTVKTMPLSTLPGGKETVLVFAENEEVFATIQDVLTVLGYRVVLGKEWKQSLDLLRTNAIHLVLIDVNGSSDPSARKLIDAIGRLKSPVPIVVLRDSKSADYNGSLTILKPFDLIGLATAVRRALDGGLS
jgi:PAS domain S-box-containing protein